MRDTSQLVARGLEPMCGWDWIREHCHDLDGFTPKIEIIRLGARFVISSKDTRKVNEAIRIVTAPKS